jgi:hypothetical protein
MQSLKMEEESLQKSKVCHTLHKMGLILHSIERITKVQFSVARKFVLRPVHGYIVKRTEKPQKP